MDTDFMQFLEGVLEDDALNKTQEQRTALRDRLYQPEYGVCSGCGGPLVKDHADGVPYFCHTNSNTMSTCVYTDKHGIVPEWAFFANEIFED